MSGLQLVFAIFAPMAWPDIACILQTIKFVCKYIFLKLKKKI
jgi:hypothetical protein